MAPNHAFDALILSAEFMRAGWSLQSPGISICTMRWADKFLATPTRSLPPAVRSGIVHTDTPLRDGDARAPADFLPTNSSAVVPPAVTKLYQYATVAGWPTAATPQRLPHAPRERNAGARRFVRTRLVDQASPCTEAQDSDAYRRRPRPALHDRHLSLPNKPGLCRWGRPALTRDTSSLSTATTSMPRELPWADVSSPSAERDD